MTQAYEIIEHSYDVVIVGAGGLLGEAAQMNAVAVTTAKDQVRLPRAIQGHVTVFAIKLGFAKILGVRGISRPALA
jgi:hypothetical protein